MEFIINNVPFISVEKQNNVKQADKLFEEANELVSGYPSNVPD